MKKQRKRKKRKVSENVEWIPLYTKPKRCSTRKSKTHNRKALRAMKRMVKKGLPSEINLIFGVEIVKKENL